MRLYPNRSAKTMLSQCHKLAQRACARSESAPCRCQQRSRTSGVGRSRSATSCGCFADLQGGHTTEVLQALHCTSLRALLLHVAVRVHEDRERMAATLRDACASFVGVEDAVFFHAPYAATSLYPSHTPLFCVVGRLTNVAEVSMRLLDLLPLHSHFGALPGDEKVRRLVMVSMN